ncbi:TonB-dependent receptor [Oxalobacteraceae bacterium A2-2]
MKPTQRCGAIAALVCTLGVAGQPLPAHAEEKRQFDIAAGPGARAIAEFTRQSGVNLLASGNELDQVALKAVKGRYTVAEALSLLLAGSGLAGRLMPGGSVFIERETPPPKAAALPLAPAHATTPAFSDTPPVVIVPGFRASMDTAQDIKRQADGIVDAIVAEDVAKFPDANLAESLQRVPGVALIRGEGGEGRQITVRGLSPTYTRVRINGIEADAASGASDINGSTNRSRAVDFSVFAAELFSNLQVRKTATADMDEGSLGATVDLRSPRPFDFKGGKFSLGGQELNNSVARRTEPRASGLLSQRWSTSYGEVGALLAGTYARRRATEEGYEAVDLLAASADGGFCSPLGVAPQNPGNQAVKGVTPASCGFGVPRLASSDAYNLVMGQTDDYGGTVANPAPGSGAFHPRLPRYRRSQTDYVRSGLAGTLQWRPRPGTELSLDLMQGAFSNERSDQYIAALSFGRTLGAANGKPQTSIVDAHFNQNGSWDYGLFNAVDVRSEALLDVYKTRFRQHVLSGSHRASDTLTLDFVYGVSSSDLLEPTRTTVQFDAPNVNGFSWDFRGNRNVPTLNFGIDVANPANFSFGPQEADGTYHGAYVGRYLRTSNRLQTTQVGASWQFTEHWSLKGGLSDRRNAWSNFEIASGGAGIALPAGVSVADITTRLTDFGRGLGGAGVPSSWVTVDLPKFLSVFNVGCHCQGVPGSQYQYYGQANRKVDEDITAAYGRLDFRYELPQLTLRGNVGVRGVETTLTASALNDAGGVLLPTTVQRRYDDWLPALNLAAQLPRDVVLRFATGKTMARPEYVDLSPLATVNPQQQYVVVGNPALAPIRARTYDLQAEWYYAPKAMVSLGYFRKQTSTFIQSLSERTTWSALGLPDSLLTAGGCSFGATGNVCPTQPDSTVVVNRKVNTPGGTLDGLEFTLQAPFSFLPGAWSNFGLLANATRVRSRVTYITRIDNPTTAANEQLTQSADFVGLSPRTHNLTLYYEDKRLSARASLAYRSRYLLEVAGNVTGYDYTMADASTHVDMSVSYQLSPNVRVSLEAQNLTDEPLRYARDSQRNDTLLYVHSGRTYAVGLRYTY